MQNILMYNDPTVLFDDLNVGFDGIFYGFSGPKKNKNFNIYNFQINYKVIGRKRFNFLKQYKVIAKAKKFFHIKKEIIGSRNIGEILKLLAVE